MSVGPDTVQDREVFRGGAQHVAPVREDPEGEPTPIGTPPPQERNSPVYSPSEEVDEYADMPEMIDEEDDGAEAVRVPSTELVFRNDLDTQGVNDSREVPVPEDDPEEALISGARFATYVVTHGMCRQRKSVLVVDRDESRVLLLKWKTWSKDQRKGCLLYTSPSPRDPG